MHDNDPKHTFGKVKKYLSSKSTEKKSRFSIMDDWPSQSPDCNPLEMLWEECDRQVRKRKPTNLCQLEETVKSVWENMSASKMNKLVARMPDICKAVLKAHGGYFIEKNVRKVAKETVY